MRQSVGLLPARAEAVREVRRLVDEHVRGIVTYAEAVDRPVP